MKSFIYKDFFFFLQNKTKCLMCVCVHVLSLAPDNESSVFCSGS